MKRRAIRILHLDDDPVDSDRIKSTLEMEGLPCEIERVVTCSDFLAKQKGNNHDIVISEVSAASFHGFDALEAANPDVPFIFVSRRLGEELTVEVLKRGATDCVKKQRLDRLAPAVRRALDEAEDRRGRRVAEERLRLTERAVEQSREAIVILAAKEDGEEPEIIFVNPAFTRMAGYAVSEAIGKTASILHGPKTSRNLLERLRNQLAKGEKFEGEGINYRKDGTEFFMHWYVEPMRDGHGKITHFVAVQRDVTEEKRAELALRKAEEKYRGIFENAVEGIFQSTPSGQYVSVNSSLARMYGYDSPEDLMSTITQIDKQLYVNAGWREKFVKAMEKTGSVSKFESQVHRKDGSIIWISEHAREVRNVGGRLLYYEGTVEEITERKRAEDQIAEQAALLNKAHDAILVLTLDNTVQFWNKGAERLYGWAEAEIVGKPAETLFAAPDQAELGIVRAAVLETGEWTGELRQVRKNGKAITVESRCSLVRSDDGAPKTILVINTDITERKLLESQFLQAQRMESIGMLAGGVAHDLNNVLAPILMASYYLHDRYEDEEGRRVLMTLQESAQRGADLVKQVLSFARGIESERSLVQPRHILTEIANMASQTFPKSVQIRRNVGKDLWAIMGDTTQLHQVLLNLCVNARDAMSNGGIITMNAENKDFPETMKVGRVEIKRGSYIVITVADTGTGIPPEVVEKIFDPFFTTKEAGKGTGLGLSTVQAIVTSHGGAIEVQSEVGKGTKFIVYLPAVGSQSLTADPAEMKVALPAGQGESILIVDDEAAILEITKETLESYGYKVVTAVNGREAVHVYSQMKDKIDCALIDNMMPHMDGPTTILELQKINPAIRIISVSGSSADEIEGDRRSIRAFLTKPYSLADLLNVLREALAPAASAA